MWVLSILLMIVLFVIGVVLLRVLSNQAKRLSVLLLKRYSEQVEQLKHFINI